MKNNLFLLLLVNICMHVCAQSDVTTAKWMHVTIDGNDTEWGSLNLYDDQTQLNFAIANDSNNIYLCFATINEPVQMKLMHAGMKITLSTKGKSKHDVSILFPLPQAKHSQFPDSADKGNNNTYTHSAFNRETFRQNYIAAHSTMLITGFATLNGEVSTQNPLVSAAINWDTASNLIYEVAISKKEFFGAEYSSKEIMQDITLNVEVNALPHSASDGENHNGSYQHEGMHDGGGMHGGGMHSGGYSGGRRYGGGEENSMSNPGSNVSLSTKTSFKQKFVLNDGNN